MSKGKRSKEVSLETGSTVEEVAEAPVVEEKVEAKPEPASEASPSVSNEIKIGQTLDTPHDGPGKVVHWDSNARVAHVDVTGAIVAVTVP